jgi:hypothetical protein
VLNPRKLAAIDIAFLGARLNLTEYAIGVLVPPALGIWTMFRGGSYWQLALGLYLILLGINYVPLLAYAMAISKGHSAHAEMSDELSGKRRAMAKYRRQSICLLAPPLAPITALRQGNWAARG